MTPRAYLDHAATSPLTARARQAWLAALDVPGNASSVHVEGQRARAIVEDARHLVAQALDVHDDEIVFTGSGTEANNLALRGTCWMAGGRPRVVASSIEHESVRRTLRWLGSRDEADVCLVSPGADGIVDAERVMAACGTDAALVSVMAVNNEVGTIQPIEDIGRACRERGIPFHVDAVQALGRIEVKPAGVPADLLTLSAHKVGGPQGCGVLFVRRTVKLQPALTGGEQESGLRPGTESVAVIASAACAIADAVEARGARSQHFAALTARLERGLTALPQFRLNGASGARAPGFTNMSFGAADGGILMQALDLAGFAVSTGSACTSGSIAPSHVLQEMGLSDGLARAAVRVSLGPGNTEAEVDGLLGALPVILARMGASGRRSE
jgi:cysteine desulfurase